MIRNPGTDPSPLRRPELLRAPRTADALALVPSLIGLVPTDSVVVVPFSGARAGGGFRIGLPDRVGEAEIEQLTAACLRTIRAIEGVTAVLAVVYTGETFRSEGVIPLRGLGDGLLRCFERAEYDIVDLACVAADGWGRYTEQGETHAPRPLAEIEASEAGLLARAVAPTPLDLTDEAALPAVSEEERGIVAETLRLCWDAGVESPVAVVERWLQGPVSVRRDGRVVRILQSPMLRDAVTVQIASGPEVAEEAHREQVRLHMLRALSGRSMDEVVEEECAAGRSGGAHEAGAALMMGVGPAPDRDRLEAATTALARLASLAPTEARSPVLTVLAWCWWARGIASVADIHLREALRLDPDYPLAQLYRTVFDVQPTPEWVTAAASSSLLRAVREA